jgi:Zn-dependent protease with chaperone function
MGVVRRVAIVGVLSLISACSGVQHILPEADQLAFDSARQEIDAYPQSLSGNFIETQEARAKLAQVYEKLRPAARQVCEFVDEQETCWWNVKYSSDPELNAYANKKNQIVVHHGVMKHSSSDSELALVLAHEMGHHIADHIDESKAQTVTGAIIGALAAGALLYSAGPCYSVTCQQSASDAIESSAEVGAAIGRISFSKKQEREADMLAAFILFNAGYDLHESRLMLVKMGAISPNRKTRLFDTHPAGPERLATYDKVIQTVYMDDNFMPNKKSHEATIARVRSSEVNSKHSEEKQVQDNRNRDPDTYSASTHGEPLKFKFKEFNSNIMPVPEKNEVRIIYQSKKRATQNTAHSGRYPTADSENSDSAVKCYRDGDKYVCDKQEK